MKVLIIGDDTDDAGAAAKLERAGQEAVSCRASDPSRVCRAAEPGDRCPLDDGVDVALAPVSLADDHRGRTLGYDCTRRAGIPIVAIGAAPTPSDDPSTLLVHDLHDVAAVLAGVASRPVEPHTTVARMAVRESFDNHDLQDVDASAWVERRDGRLQIRISTEGEVAAPAAHAAAVRALAAVRGVDRRASTIGVSIG